MLTIKVNKNSFSNNDVKKIVEALTKGGLVLMPTETVYTFAVDATRESLIKKVYELKGRDFNKPLHVVVDSLKTAKQYVAVNGAARKLAERFLPGPLTLVLPKKENSLPDILTSGLPSLGIRIPNLSICLEVAKMYGRPYTTTSANISGGPNPYSVEEVLGQLSDEKKKIIDLVVDTGSLPNLLPSTLVDLTTKPFQILREGPITKAQIEEVVGVVA